MTVLFQRDPFYGFECDNIAERDPVPGVHVSQCPTNPNYRYYSHRVSIGGHYIWHSGSPHLLDEAKDHPTLDALERVPGIQGIMNWEGYQLNITKAAAFTWEEIEPAILKILQEHNSIERLI